MKKSLIIPQREHAIKLFELRGSITQNAFCCWLQKTPPEDPSLHFEGYSKYFIFDFMYNNLISVRVSPDDIMEVVNDYHIRKNKTVLEFATPLALAKLDEADREKCQIAFKECSVECFSTPGQILEKDSDVFEFIAEEVSSTTYGGEDCELLINFFYQVYCAEQEIYKGNRSFPISLYDYQFPTKELDECHSVGKDRCLKISYRPYLGNDKNPTPWSISAIERTTTYEKSFWEETEIIEDRESKPISVYLTTEEADQLIEKLTYQLEKLGIAQPTYPEEFFPISTAPSPRRKKK